MRCEIKNRIRGDGPTSRSGADNRESRKVKRYFELFVSQSLLSI